MGVKNNDLGKRTTAFRGQQGVSGKEEVWHTATISRVVNTNPWAELLGSDNYTANATSTSRPSARLEIIAVGGGGASDQPTQPSPGLLASQGGFTIARYSIPKTTTLEYFVGEGGLGGSPGPGAGGASYGPNANSQGGGGSGYSQYPPASTYGGGGGGGMTGVCVATFSHANALVIAGGGGGAKYGNEGGPTDKGWGGHGGGATAGNGTDGEGTHTNSAGTGGSNPTSAGGSGGEDQGGQNSWGGSAFAGGNNRSSNVNTIAYGGGGGGGGYYGGGSGGSSNTSGGQNSGGAGGGTGFFSTASPPAWTYVPSPTVERNYLGMGYPGYTGPTDTGALGPYPLGSGKDHPQIAPLLPTSNYGAGGKDGILIINYYS